jgi:Ecdysteroid kinase-like family
MTIAAVLVALLKSTTTLLKSTMTDCPESLLPVLQEVLPDVKSYETLKVISQAGAEGRILKVDTGKTIFIKTVSARAYEHKKWPDLRRTLLYIRTEARFYNETLPLMEAKGLKGMAPHCYRATYNLEGLISDNDKSVDVSQTEPIGEGVLDGKGGCLILDCMDMNVYFQDSPLTPAQCKQCLAACAKLHAAAWEDCELLTEAELRLSRGSYSLQMRNPKEYQGLVQAWENFMANFRDQAPELFEKESVQQLGERTHKLAEYISRQTMLEPTDPCATLVHGDYKSMNVFIPQDATKDAVMIDFASTGVGVGMSDVAMHIYHALKPQDIDEDDLIDSYLQVLNESRRMVNPAAVPYSKEAATRHFRLAVVDYFRFFCGRFWTSSSMETFAKAKDAPNINLINRNVKSALNFVAKVDEFLGEIEKEHAATII